MESTELPGEHPTETIRGEMRPHVIVRPAPAVQNLHAPRFSRMKSWRIKRKTDDLVRLTDTRRRIQLEKTSWVG